MEVQAVTKYVRISPQKANEVARIIRKTLQSAIANAENNAQLDVNDLVVKSAEVGGGPVIKRFIAVARGSAHPLLKRTAHIRIVLSDEGGRGKGKVKSSAAAGKAKAPRAAKPAAGAGAGAETAKGEEKKA